MNWATPRQSPHDISALTRAFFDCLNYGNRKLRMLRKKGYQFLDERHFIRMSYREEVHSLCGHHCAISKVELGLNSPLMNKQKDCKSRCMHNLIAMTMLSVFPVSAAAKFGDIYLSKLGSPISAAKLPLFRPQ